jgi:hypothetical protein
MTRTQSSPLPWLLLGAACLVTAIILGQHAIAKHGAGVTLARSEFNCRQLPEAELYSEKRDTYLYLCFVDQIRMAAQVLSDQRDDPQSREITTIPAEHISKAQNYARSVITRDGYTLKNLYGDIPAWFKDLIANLK